MAPRHDLVTHQLARNWAQQNAGLLYADPTSPSTVLADIYTSPLPPIEHRRELACSLTVDGAPFIDGTSARISVRCEAHGPSLSATDAMLADLAGSVRPGGLAMRIDGVSNDGVTQTHGLIGVAPVLAAADDGDPVELWRVLGASVGGTQHLSTELGPAATDDGQASSVMTIDVFAAISTIEAPSAAFEIRRVSGAFSAAVGITSVGIVISSSTQSLVSDAFLFAEHPTIGQIRDAIDAVSGWDTVSIDNTFDARSSSSVLATHTHNALTGDVPVRVWA